MISMRLYSTRVFERRNSYEENVRTHILTDQVRS